MTTLLEQTSVKVVVVVLLGVQYHCCCYWLHRRLLFSYFPLVRRSTTTVLKLSPCIKRKKVMGVEANTPLYPREKTTTPGAYMIITAYPTTRIAVVVAVEVVVVVVVVVNLPMERRG